MGEEGWSLMDFSLDLLHEKEVHRVPFLLRLDDTCMGKFSIVELAFCTHDDVPCLRRAFSHRKCGLNNFQVCVFAQLTPHRKFLRNLAFLQSIHQSSFDARADFTHPLKFSQSASRSNSIKF